MLAGLIGRRAFGIHAVDDTGDGPALFRAECDMGLEGTVSKRSQSTYRPGPKKCASWVKVKNKCDRLHAVSR